MQNIPQNFLVIPDEWSVRVSSSSASKQVSNWGADFQEWSRCPGGICSDLTCSCASCGSMKEAPRSRGSGFKSSEEEGQITAPKLIMH